MSHFVAMIEDSSVMAVLSFDRNGVVRLWNSASAALYQIATADALGKSMRELLSHPEREQEFFRRSSADLGYRSADHAGRMASQHPRRACSDGIFHHAAGVPTGRCQSDFCVWTLMSPGASRPKCRR
ncbi:PAS domain-containing protein [Undibacterium arcticum]